MLPINSIGIICGLVTFHVIRGPFGKVLRASARPFTYFCTCASGGSEFSMKHHFSLNKIATIEIYVLKLVYVLICMSVRDVLFDLG